ncbi:hypothetical protein HHI36_002257 [Cryptolaemus montrouzieri]|uniref:Uncharacterized protein n=1 Tax=Cryptolaemus montrouzieri TaxID=559131 RepID=A0ABD2P9X0_9CUCU
MKTILFFIILILLIQFCLSVTANTKALEEISSRVKFYDLIKRKMKNIVYQVASRAIRSPNYNVIKSIRSKLRSLSIWMAGEEKQATFIARQIKIAMPLIMVKLGIIVTILVFLTIFSLKTIGLLLILFMFGASNLVAKFALWKDHSSQNQRRPSVHFHIHQSKNGGYSVAGPSIPWEKSSSENFSNNMFETDEGIKEKLDLLKKLQYGLYNPYSIETSADSNFKRR